MSTSKSIPYKRRILRISTQNIIRETQMFPLFSSQVGCSLSGYLQRKNIPYKGWIFTEIYPKNYSVKNRNGSSGFLISGQLPLRISSTKKYPIQGLDRFRISTRRNNPSKTQMFFPSSHRWVVPSRDVYLEKYPIQETDSQDIHPKNYPRDTDVSSVFLTSGLFPFRISSTKKYPIQGLDLHRNLPKKLFR